MKTKVKRYSRRSMAVILSVLMIVTCLVVGQITTANAYSGVTLYYTTSSSGPWSSASSTAMTMSNNNNTATKSLTLSANKTYRFILVADNNDWWGNNSFDLSTSTSKSNNLGKFGSFTSSNQISQNPNTLKTSTQASYTFTFTLSSGSCTVSGGSGSSSSSCSTNKTYRIVGTANIAGSAWANNATANNMTYSSSLKCYTKTYSNVGGSNQTMDFRIIEGSTWSTTWGFDRANKVDDSSIVTTWSVKPGSDGDNNIRMVTNQKANVEIRLDDSKTNTSAITVIVTPASSTVTAGSCTGGSVKVNNATSASNIAYGGSVSLSATPSANYHFAHWNSNDKLDYANSGSATTTATVTGTTTVYATFEGDNFNITKSATNCTLTAPNSAAYNSTVSVSATAASGYAINSIWYSTDGGTTKTTIANASSGNFTMPASNVTVGAVTHELQKYTVTYGVCSGQSSYGYVSVGEYYNSATTMKHTIDSGTNVLENTKVNFNARPVVGKKFVGWYNTSAASGGTQLSPNQDVTVTVDAAKTYYARFADAPATVVPDPYLASDKVTLFIASSNKDVYIYTWNGGDIGTSWPGYKSTNNNDYVTIGGQQYMKVQTTKTSFKLQLNLGNNSNQSSDYTFSGTLGNGYYLTYNVNGQAVTKSNYTSQATTTPDPDAATDAYFPIKYYVTNADKGANTVRSPLFGKAGNSVTFYHSPSDTSNWKTSRTTTNFTGNLTNDKTTNTSTARTMPSTYSSTPTFTVTFIEKEYFPVTFSSGPNGKVQACTGTSWNDSNEIKSGTLVKEGTNVTFKATANSGYTFTKWTTSTSTSSLDTNSTNYWQVTTTNQGLDRKGWFKRSTDKGTALTGKYLAYGTNINYQVWNTGLSLYHKNGRVYAYLDSPSNSTTYYFSLCDNKNPSGNLNGNNLAAGCWGWGKTGTTCVTDFTAYLSNTGVQQYDVNWNYNDGQGDKYRGTNYYGKTTVKSSAVSQLIIDVGEWNGSDLSFGDSYRVIPVYDTDETNVDIYAKDGSYRGDSLYDYFPGIANTVLTGASNIKNQSEFDTGSAMRGTTITVTTTIDSTHKGDFYVRGFSFNGVTPALLESNNTGVYTQSYTIPADFDYDYLEITPIYYYKYGNHGVTADNVVQFYIENYDKALEATGWGNTLSVYPYYQSGSSWVEKKQNSFGGYPGQPVIYYGGRRFVEIPTNYDTFTYDNGGSTQNCTIKGVTLSNDYWDIVHREYCHAVTEHKQTYDYDDFVKIFRETTDNQEKNGKTGLADQITFQFKYRTTTNNFADSSVTSTDKNTGSTAAGNTGVHQPYNSFTEAQKTSKFGNDWEPLLDYLDRPVDLFGKQLTDAQKELDPVLVVSDDYEVTYAGSYATTWTVYARANASSNYTKIAEIAPSALIVTSKTRLDDTTLYPVTADQGGLDPTTLQEFGSAYNSLLAYKERPVQITYEKAIENNSSYEKYYNKSGVVTNGWISEKAVRNDGRWTYSYYNDDIHANIRIEYKNDESDAEWTTDAFKGDTNQGIVTGAKAYFTNTDLNKAGESFENKTETGTVVSDQNKFYEFAAEAAPGYVFAGWWFERDNIVTDVNSDHTLLTGHSQMTSNATFVARYIKSPTGTLTVNHNIADSSEVKDATTYVAVKAKKTGQSDVWLTGARTAADHFTAKAFAVDSNYVAYKSGYTFEITLKTVADNDFVNFNRFSAKDDEHSPEYFVAGKSTSGTTTTSETFTVSVDDLFAINSKGFPEQQFDTLTYYSHLDSKTYGYNFNYTYPSYLYEKYGHQGYRVTGTFTYDELKDNMQITNSNLLFATDAKKEAILNKLAPYEDNFRQTISWETSVNTTFASNTNTISATVPAVTASDYKINLTFKFKYATDSDYQPVENAVYNANVPVIDITGNERPSHMQLFKKNNKFVTAPRSLMDNGTEMIFRHWKVSTQPNDHNTSSREYTRCYDNEFNFVLFQDSIVEAVYTASEANAEQHIRDGYDPDAEEEKDQSLGVTINFMENSRNQYNDGQSYENGYTQMTQNRRQQGDRMYTDFLLNFNNVAKTEGITELNTLAANTKKVGLIIETVGNIDQVDGRYVTKTHDEYSTLYGSNISEIGSKLSTIVNGKQVDFDQMGKLTDLINGTITTTQFGGYKSEFDVRDLDNKNRIQYAYSLANRSHSNFSLISDNRYKVFRAYAYIADYSAGTGTYSNIQISNVPVYFTIYDMASVQNYAEAQASGGIQ